MENKVLLPCPFCGWDKPEIHINDQTFMISVRCVCGAGSKEVSLNLPDSTKMATDFWNMRSNPFLNLKINDVED